MNEQMYQNFLKTCFKVMKFVRNPQVTTVLVFVFVLSVILFKLVNEPYIFDPKFGAQSVYGFSASDAKEPFTVFYIAKGVDFTGANGSFQVLNQTLQIKRENNTSAEWVFESRRFLNILKRYGGEIKEATLLFSKPNPFSSAKDTSVLIYVNDYLVANKSLSTTSEDKYTWNVRTQLNIPGTNYGYPYVFAIFSIPKDSVFSDMNDNLPARVRVVTSEGVNWTIDYVVVKLSSDPYALKSPWWRQNFLLILNSYISVFLIALTAMVFKFEWKRRSSQLSTIDAVKRWVSSNRFILSCMGTGLLLRIMLIIILPIGSGDQPTYRFISMASYYYGVDTRSFYSLYGTVWHGLLLASYPVYLLLSPFASSISLEYIVLKLPIIASDILIAFLLYCIGSKLADEKIAKILLVFWLFSPYVIWLSPIFGTHHIVPTMLTVLAVERIIYGHYKSSAIALSAAVFSGLNTVFLLPVFVILIYKSLGKPRLVEFLNFFLLGCSIFALPWAFSIAIFFNTYTGAGRSGFPTLSYSYFLMPTWLIGFWSVVSLLVGLILLCVYITRKNQFNISQIIDYILIVFLIFYLTNTLVFPTYVLWSLPFLLFAYVSTRKIPLSYVAFFMVFPILWLLYWPLTQVMINVEEIFRDTFGLNFSILSILIIIKLIFQKAEQNFTFEVPKLRSIKFGSWIKTTLLTYLVLAVFTPWIQLPLWLNLWNTVLNPAFFMLSTILLFFTFIMQERKKFYNDEIHNQGVFSLSKAQQLSILLLTIAWLYNLTSLISGAITSTILQGTVFFSLILVLWLPLIILEISKTNENTQLITWIAFLQIDYIIIRNYNSPINTNPLILGINFLVPVLTAFLLAIVVYLRSKQK